MCNGQQVHTRMSMRVIKAISIVIMPRLDVETRRRVVLLRKAGYRVRDIKERLVEERIVVSERSIHKLPRMVEYRYSSLGMLRLHV